MSRLYTRAGLIESIGTARALAATADTTDEYQLWRGREAELRKLAIPGFSSSEESAIEDKMQEKVEAYEHDAPKTQIQ